jgi:hypothetical protein
MIKFFNKIRKRLLSENKLSKYFIYAIGEIALVVIGILIALQINNASEANKLNQKEFILLLEMQSNLEEDLRDITFNVSGNSKRNLANQKVYKALKTKKPFNDSLENFYGNIFGNFQLTENTAAWENLKSVGLDLISDDTLRSSISHLYSTSYKYLENLEQNLDNNYQWDYLYPQILEHITIDKLWVSASPLNHEALMDDREFQEVLKMNMFFRDYMQNQYNQVQSEVNSLLEQIKNHVQTLK